MSILARLFPSRAEIARLRAVNEILVARRICDEAHIERLNGEIDALHRDIAEMESDLFDSRDGGRLVTGELVRLVPKGTV